MVYNIAYGTGTPDAFYERFLTGHRYLRTSQVHLDKIMEFIEKEKPDILGLVEVDTGSIRTKFINQVETIANHLNHFHHSSVKYGKDSLGRTIPILRMQGNAVLTKKQIPDSHFHYFPVGFKRLIIELDIGGISFFLVHLALKKRIRKKQFRFLAEIAKTHENIIIAGDFNTFKGNKEIAELQQELKLINPNRKSLPTYPSWNPHRELDFILHSKNIKVTRFAVPKVRFSDHLPIIMEYHLKK
jgi:endonuclease/exonuclease/phosphatase family metal-dependent hydrolase